MTHIPTRHERIYWQSIWRDVWHFVLGVFAGLILSAVVRAATLDDVTPILCEEAQYRLLDEGFAPDVVATVMQNCRCIHERMCAKPVETAREWSA